MQSVFTTGFIACFVSLPGGRAPRLLGTGEQPPQTSLKKSYIPLMNDIAGPVEPFDEISAGRNAVSQVDLTRWDEEILERLEAQIDYGDNTDEGEEQAADLGTIMGLEGKYLQVWFLAARRNVPAMVAAGMPAGFCYPYSTCIDVTRRPGNQANGGALIFQHRRIWQPKTGKFLLRHTDMDPVARIPLV